MPMPARVAHSRINLPRGSALEGNMATFIANHVVHCTGPFIHTRQVMQGFGRGRQ